jgi:hypothetical protein
LFFKISEPVAGKFEKIENILFYNTITLTLTPYDVRAGALGVTPRASAVLSVSRERPRAREPREASSARTSDVVPTNKYVMYKIYNY